MSVFEPVLAQMLKHWGLFPKCQTSLLKPQKMMR